MFATMCMSLAACNADAGVNEARQLNDALLELLTSQGRTICVDSTPYGEPLAAFRSMQPAPEPARRPLFWRTPVPLEPGRNLTNRELVDIEFRDDQTVLPEQSGAGRALPVIAQLQLNAIAREASVMMSGSDATIAGSPAAPRAKVRWWLRNRFDSTCTAPYTVSKPILLHGIGLVSVTAAHHGSTYAFKRVNSGWMPVAKWATWLY